MSLEAAIEANTVALNKVAVLLEQSNAGREAAIAKVEAIAGASEAEKPTTGRRGRPVGSTNKPAETLVADAPAPEPEEVKSPAAPAVPTEDDVRNAAKAFAYPTKNDGTVNEDEKARRKPFLAAVNQHLALDKVTSAKPEDRAQIIAWFAAFARGESVNFSEGEDDVTADEDDIG